MNDNGPDGKHWEAGEPNGHRQEVAPLKRILERTIPELSGELSHVDTSKNRSRMTPCRDSILSVDRGNGGVDVLAAKLFSMPMIG